MSHVTREEIVAEARRWLETPYHHQARVLGVGVDCAGVVVGVAHALGLSDHDVKGYARTPSAGLLERELEAHMERIAVKDVRPGDVLLMRIKHDPQHLALVSGIDPLSVIHAHLGVGECVEHRVDEMWRKRIVRAYRYRGIE